MPAVYNNKKYKKNDMPNHFVIFLIVMSALAVIVFVALYFVEAGYGMLLDKKWGIAINNKAAWFCMESPVVIAMTVLWILSDRTFSLVPLIFFLFFQTHYIRRALIFPFMMRGANKMPLSIMFLGIIFNVCNALMQGGWIFFYAPADMYTSAWLLKPCFIIGTIIYFGGMIINIQSDKIIQDLRKPGDTKHYLPTRGLFKYITSAHYFGEIIEWVGFAILTWSWSGAVFALWTFANLVPRANAVYYKYQTLFGKDTIKDKKLKRVFPFIY